MDTDREGVGVFRFVQRFGANRKPSEAGSTLRQPSRASVPASVLGLWCVDPRNRSMILSLLSTNAISLFFRDFVAKHPEYTLLQCAGETPLYVSLGPDHSAADALAAC